MARNQKLAPLLAGRTLATVEPPTAHAAAPASRFAPSAGVKWPVHFGDGATLAVRTDGTPPEGLEQAAQGSVADVTQRGTTLRVEVGGGKALVFRTAEASGCVLLRGPDGAMLYAD